VATLKQAEAARTKSAEKLRKLGAHAIEVAPVAKPVSKGKVKGKSDYAVVAHFDKTPSDAVPESVQVKTAGKTTQVKVMTKRSARYTLD
jgi:hypothetical protein